VKLGDILFGAISIAIGIWAGQSLGNTPGAIMGAIVGFGNGAVVAYLKLRFSIAIPVLSGTVAGGLLGRSIVRAICFPGTCNSAEVAAALLTGVGSLIGVGLVTALVVKSFDEYRQANPPMGNAD